MNGKFLSFFPSPVFPVYSFALSYAQHRFPDLVSMEHSTNGSRPPFMHSPGSFLSLCHLLLQYRPAIVSQVKHPCPLQYACAVRVLRLFLPYGHRSCLIQDPSSAGSSPGQPRLHKAKSSSAVCPFPFRPASQLCCPHFCIGNGILFLAYAFFPFQFSGYKELTAILSAVSSLSLLNAVI